MWAGIGDAGDPGRQHHRECRPPQDRQRQAEEGEDGHLDLLGLELFAEIFGGAPDHQPGNEHRHDSETEDAVEAGADAAEDHLAELHIDQRHHPAQGQIAVVHGVDRTARGVGRDRGPQRRQRRAKAHLLAFHIPAGLDGAGRRIDRVLGKGRVAVCFRPIGGGDAGEKQNAHHCEQSPALALVLDHAAQDVRQRRADCEDRDQLDQIGDRIRVLERMRRIGVEKTAAVGAELLDDLLRGDGALRDHLLDAFERRRLGIGAEILRHPLPYQDQPDHHRDR
ncbi:MAG: hypothetical protein WB678_08185 [Stellaceae bacterium]